MTSNAIREVLTLSPLFRGVEETVLDRLLSNDTVAIRSF